jgi:DNA-binding NarL/FixJ family response regulator
MTSAAERTVILAVGFGRALAECIQCSLTREAPAEVVGISATVGDLLRAVREHEPDVILIDAGHPELSRLVRSLAGSDPRPDIVALDVEPAEEAVIELAELGVSSFVWRDSSLADLERILREVRRGEVSCPPTVTAALLRHVAAMAQPAGVSQPPDGPLTRREVEIVQLIGEGLSNKEIARRLGIAPQTVKNHVHNLLQKLGVRGREDAAERVRAPVRLPALDLSRY